jgi:hypothetical protein
MDILRWSATTIADGGGIAIRRRRVAFSLANRYIPKQEMLRFCESGLVKVVL